MKNSRHFGTFLRNNIKSIKNNSINEEVFNKKFTKMDLIDFIFDQIVLILYKEKFNDKLLIWLKKLFIKRRKFISKAFALFTTGLEVYAFYLVIGKLITSITMQFFMFFFTMFIELGVELKKLWSKTSVYVHSFFKNNYLLMS